jgi:hypothetical protein
MEDWKDRATADAAQDSMENAPFASVGGLDNRACLVAPPWAAGHEDEYLEGYSEAALGMYGPDWRTCSFGWAPALTLPGNVEVVAQEDDGEIQ